MNAVDSCIQTLPKYSASAQRDEFDGVSALREELDVVVAARTDETGDIIVLDLVAAGADQLPAFTAGAHVDVFLDNDLTRQYSICNDPCERHRYRIGILKEPSSRGGSAFIHANVRQASRLRISPPRNKFPLAEEGLHSILIAGGIGITPIISMAHRLSTISRSFSLHYCCRTLSRAAFLTEIRNSAFADAVTLHLDDGGAEQAFDFDRDVGLPERGVHIYVCGPAGLIDRMMANAYTSGWSDEQVHFERFMSAPDAVSSDAGFTVTAARSAVTVEVPGDKSIANALLEAGVDIALSCEQGICRTCLTKVLEGDPIHMDDCLSEAERRSSKLIAICCSRAKGKIILDI